MKKYLWLFIVLLLAACTTNTFTKEEKDSLIYADGKISKEFSVKSGELLVIEFEIGTNLKIEGWDKNVVNVVIDGNDKDLNKIEFDFSHDGDKVVLRAEYKNKKKNNHFHEVETSIKVPKTFNIDFHTTGGAVSIDEVTGSLAGKTMGGSLDFNKLKGTADFTTMGGNVTVTNSELDGKIKTMGGSINLDSVDGELNVETMGGNITTANVNLQKKDGSDGVTVKTMGGNIRLDKMLTNGRVSTMGGNISIDYVKGTVEASTMGGSVFVEKVDGGINAKTMGGTIEVKCEKISDDVVLSTNAGNVELEIPSDADVNFQIKVNGFFPEDDKYENYIDSDFNLKYEVDGETLRASGNNGSGKYTVELSSGNGKVVLKKK